MRHEGSVNKRNPRVCQILQRDEHAVLVRPSGTYEKHAVAFARLEREAAVALSFCFRQHIQIGEPLIKQNRLALGNGTPVEWMFPNVAIRWLLQILQRVVGFSIGRLKRVKKLNDVGNRLTCLIRVDGYTRLAHSTRSGRATNFHRAGNILLNITAAELEFKASVTVLSNRR